MSNIEIDLKPQKEQIKVIKDLITIEDGMKHSLFYDWDTDVKPAISRGNLAAINLDEKTIGYFAYEDYSDNKHGLQVVKILHAWIEKTHRNKGYGKEGLMLILKEFRKEGYELVIGDCASDEGSKLCESIGFLPFNLAYSGDNRKVYLPLRHCRKENKNKGGWQLEIYPEFHPERSHAFSLDGELTKEPIITDIPPDWKVQIERNNNVIKEDKAKYIIPKLNCKTALGRFVCIDTLI